ncbi:hypothetical protein ACIRNI_31475 [Streptomyces sp. NPDC093546]|uniref:hypothetical protein n=1 Tax=Streptomyces sp. NPDC093546 TaxID=3366040 RepID=UPI003813A3B7
MALQDDLTEVKRNLEELARSIIRLEQNLAQQREGTSPSAAVGRPEGLVTISDDPYDSSLWIDTDDEGLGARGRRAP